MTRGDDSRRDEADWGGEGVVYTATFPGEYGELPSTSVVETVAEATGVEATRLRPLYDVIDPDALDRLFGDPPGRSLDAATGLVTFRYEGCDVSVHADGRTVVAPRAE